jgi:hypothetical protein
MSVTNRGRFGDMLFCAILVAYDQTGKART